MIDVAGRACAYKRPLLGKKQTNFITNGFALTKIEGIITMQQ